MYLANVDEERNGMPVLPREVLFEVMRSSFRITFRELCELILSDEPIGGLSPRERGRDAARRNREFVHVAPGADDAYWQLAPQREYVKNLYDAILDRMGAESGEDAIVDVFSGIGAAALRASLDACNLDGSIYTNIVNYILVGHQSSIITSCMLIHLFVATAVSGNPAQAAQEVVHTVYSFNDATIRTETPPIQECETPPLPKQRLALMRISDMTLFPSRTYPLSTEPEGTDVGSVLHTPGCITDVERGVSRRHLHIWRDDEGNWWCKGMHSLNGTKLFDRFRKDYTVIEPARSERPDDYEPRPFPLHLADTLILAEKTEFFVVSIGE